MNPHQVLIAGKWQDSDATGTFQAENPKTASLLPGIYPTSSWAECERALGAAASAFAQLRQLPREALANFLEKYAERIEERATEICELAALETALPYQPRLLDIELPRTTGQLRQAAAATRAGDWCRPTIDRQNNIRSYYAALGPVAVFGPNNFPLAFGSLSGGDFASAIAAGNPVIAKAHPLHPGTTRLLAEEAQLAAEETELPPGTVQLIYDMNYDDGEKLARDRRLAAIAFTGSRQGGLKLKTAADSVGKPIYLELSSINPLVVLDGALDERGEEIASELAQSCLMGTGQFCTSPGFVIVGQSDAASQFVSSLKEKFSGSPVGTLLSKSGQTGLSQAIKKLVDAGALQVCGGTEGGGEGFSHANTLLQVSGDQFLANPEILQTEAFGNASLVVTASSLDQIESILQTLEGNLTGCIYSHTQGSDDEAYDRIEPLLRQRVGRLLNDKMPTGVAVSSAMNHGGPFPAAGHPGFTAVGIPGSLLRFAMLQCFDNIRQERLPEILRDENPGNVWRFVDGTWTQASLEPAAV